MSQSYFAALIIKGSDAYLNSIVGLIATKRLTFFSKCKGFKAKANAEINVPYDYPKTINFYLFYLFLRMKSITESKS